MLALLMCGISAMHAQNKQLPAGAGAKPKMSIEKGDAKLTIGGKTKIEHFFHDNAYLLNKNIPDECEYFKHSLNVIFDFVYGRKQFGHDAVQLYTDLRHKSVWGKPSSYSDKASGPGGPAQVRLANTNFGNHSHTSGKPLIWMTESWLKFSFNALFDSDCENLHFFKVGWFPFSLGRGIALGSSYGMNKEILGLYSYPEDKSAPGILLSGTILKDRLKYDLYYAKFEERNKNFADTINHEKSHWIGRELQPWRGINKDDSLFAARLKIYPLPECVPGVLEIEPYWFYNDASDQFLEIAPDVKTRLHSLGFATEYAYKNLFEFGSDVAFNLGIEEVQAIDRNNAQIINHNGQLIEVYSHIVEQASGKKALVTDTTKALANNPALKENNRNLDTIYKNTSKRIRPCYKNKLRGWMGVIDATGHIPQCKLSFSGAYGYASGDQNPHVEEVNKTYKGFIGLHEFYTGKRVKSIFLLDQRLLKRPISLLPNNARADEDLAFSDLQHVGFSAQWKPKLGGKELSFNPNVIAFWKAHKSAKFDRETQKASECEKARTYMGTEANIVITAQLLKDLSFYAVFAAFFPGGYFTDISGVKLSRDYISVIEQQNPSNITIDPAKFRLSDDTAYHMNIGFSYKF